jgi:hypothetical protein
MRANPAQANYETEGHRFESCLARKRKPRSGGVFVAQAPLATALRGAVPTPVPSIGAEVSLVPSLERAAEVSGAEAPESASNPWPNPSKASGKRWRVLVGSMSDLFHIKVGLLRVTWVAEHVSEGRTPLCA